MVCIHKSEWRLRLSFTVMLLLLLCLASTSAQDRSTVSKTEVGTTKITLHLDNASIAETLDRVFAQAKMKYRLMPNLAQRLRFQRCSVHVTGVALDDVLSGILAANEPIAPLEYHVVNGLYIIEGPKLSVDFKAAPPNQALQTLFESAGVNYVYSVDALGSKPITYQVRQGDFYAALRQILQQMDHPTALTFAFHSGIYTVKRNGIIDSPEADERRVTLRLTDVDTGPALQAIFDACNVNYILPQLPSRTISLVEEDRPFRVALEDLLRRINSQSVQQSRQERELSYSIQDGMFTIQEVSTKSPPE